MRFLLLLCEYTHISHSTRVIYRTNHAVHIGPVFSFARRQIMVKVLKRTGALLPIVALTILLAACGGGATGSNATAPAGQSTDATAAPEAQATAAPAAAGQATTAPAA